MSNNEHNPWLQLSFDTQVTIEKVAVTNRFDFRGHRFFNITASVGSIPMIGQGMLSENPVCARFIGQSEMSGSVVLKCHQPLTGNYVVIQQETAFLYLLSINEVFVCGH